MSVYNVERIASSSIRCI